MFTNHTQQYTAEDTAIVVRSCKRGTFNTLVPMVMCHDDYYVMYHRVLARQLDRDYEAECADRDAAALVADWCAIDGINS